MTWSAMRGRPRDLPKDGTPLRGAYVDARARVAWLVRVSRMASPHGGTGAEFSKRLSTAGFPIGASALSRREQGQEDISGAMLSAYERVLELPPGRLRGACTSLRRACAADLCDQDAPLGRSDLSTQLRRLEVLIDGGHASGDDWLQLSRMLTEAVGIVLPPSVLENWTGRLLREMLRSVGDAYIGRYEALARLMSDAVTREPLTRAVFDLVARPGLGCQVDTLAVLGETNDPAVVEHLIELFLTGSGRLRLGAARALLRSVVIGALTVDQVKCVQRAVVTVAREDPDDGGWPAFLLAQRISLQLTRMVVSLLGFNPGDRARGAHIQDPAELDTYLRAAATATGVHEDRMLERLVREALTDDFLERRDHSSVMLLASPYRSILADTALGIVATTGDPVARDAAGSLLSYLAGPEHRADLLGLLHSASTDVQAIALHALAHAGGVPAQVSLAEYLADPRLRQDALYAAGMSGHPVLATIAASDDLDAAARDTARWWLELGPAILEGLPEAPARVADPAMDGIPSAGRTAAGAPGQRHRQDALTA